MSLLKRIHMFLIGISGNYLVRKSTLARACKMILGNKNYARLVYSRKDNNLKFRNLINYQRLKEESSKVFIDEKVVLKNLNHQFNLLGSGWITWEGGVLVKGYCGNVINQCIPSIKNDPHRIVWNVDVRTGYQFEEEFFSSSLIGNLPTGVDIKIPWEIGRMYHWPYAAIFAVQQPRQKRNEIIKEFVDQLTKFIEDNPVGKGVQFYCPMEIAIRDVNLLFTYDIFLQIDEEQIIHTEFKMRLEEYIYLSRRAIESNIEYNLQGEKNGNHYLSDLLGLIWIDSYFGKRKKLRKEAYLFFNEVDRQFLKDGCNFECSSGYHRLSSEISALGIMLIYKILGKKYVHDEVLIKLSGMSRFLKSLVGLDGNITQIGDFDSGRVLKIQQFYMFGDEENTLRSEDVMCLIDTLLSVNKEGFSIPHIYESVIDNSFITKMVTTDAELLKTIDFDLGKLIFTSEKIIDLPNDIRFKEIIAVKYERNFGLIRVDGDEGQIFIRTLPDYNMMNAAHAHEDMFHYELCSKNRRFLADVGSIAYTSDHAKRDFYAGQFSHNTPIHSKTVLKKTDVFSFKVAKNYETNATIDTDNKVITLRVSFSGIQHVRIFRIEAKRIVITDYSNDPFIVNEINRDTFSYGYGQNPRIRL